MLFIYSKVRVRRWCKRPPADGWSSGCAIWGLQVHVYHRLRASRSIPFRIRWRVECWRRRATCVVDKWQKACLTAMSCKKRNPAYRDTVSNFFILNASLGIYSMWQHLRIQFIMWRFLSVTLLFQQGPSLPLCHLPFCWAVLVLLAILWIFFAL